MRDLAAAHLGFSAPATADAVRSRYGSQAGEDEATARRTRSREGGEIWRWYAGRVNDPREPRNVTPGERGDGPEWWGWTWGNRGRGFPWLGVLLVLVGAGLLIEYFVPGISAGTLVLLAIAIAFLAGWLIGRSYVASIPGLLLLAIALARLVDETNLYNGPGTTSVFLAIAFLVIWAILYLRRRPRMWPLWGAAIFGLVGAVQLSGQIAGIPQLGALWPLAIIAVGVLVLLNARRAA